MGGRVTSMDRSRNEHGVYYDDLLKTYQETTDRYIAVLVEAIEVCDAYFESRINSEQRQKLGLHARKLIRKALG